VIIYDLDPLSQQALVPPWVGWTQIYTKPITYQESGLPANVKLSFKLIPYPRLGESPALRDWSALYRIRTRRSISSEFTAP
jgi:hypothetical protein